MPTPAPSYAESAPRTTLAGCGLTIFLSSLSMLFLAGILALIYLHAIATGAAAPESTGDSGGSGGSGGGVPHILWLSTLLLLLGSVTIDRARAAAQAGRQRPLRVYLIATVALALGFLANQIPALTILLTRHFELLRQVHREALATQPTLTTDPRRYLLGLIFFLILIHALHVVGGLVSLALATARACTAGDPRAMEGPVRFTAIYWHFLGAVWLVLFVTFLAI